jgi:hypothetical protein
MKDSYVRLTDEERRSLRAIATALESEDPGFARRLRRTRLPRLPRLSLKWTTPSLGVCIAVFVCGGGLLISTLTVSPVLAGIGYVAMFAAALAACYSTPVLRFVRDVRRRVRDFWCWRPDET